jgi:uncharacterized protein
MRNQIRIAAVILALALVGALAISTHSPVLASPPAQENDSSARTISVSGAGQVSAAPDMVVVTLGVETQSEEATTAFTENNQRMQSLVDILKEADIAPEDLRTQAVRLYPRYQDAPDGEGQNVLAGYTASNIIQVTVRDLDMVGSVLDAAVQAGGNRIQGIRFEVDEQSAYLDQARKAAWNDALHKAQQLADLSGSELGLVLTINESSHGAQPVLERVVSAESPASVPIEAGSQTITVDLQVTWLLEDGE